MTLTFLEIFTLLAIVHCFILSLVILFSKFLKSTTNFYLGISLFIIAIVGINNWFWDLNKNPILVQFLDLFLWQFLYPFTLLLYFYKATKNSISKKNKRILFLPFVFLTTCNIVVTLHNVYKIYKLAFLTSYNIELFYKIVSFCSIIYPLLLLIVSFKILFLKKYKFSVVWLQIFWGLFVLIEVYGFVLEFYRLLYLERQSLVYLWVGVSLLIYWIIYIGIYRFKLSNEQYEIRQYFASKKVTAKKEENENPKIKELVRLFSEENLHHNSQLNREIIAEKLGISAGYLSQLIKESKHKSLSNLINSYRINDVKQMLVNPEFSRYSLLAVGLEVGFNSKATFFNTFKKHTGLTPSEYKNTHKEV